MKRAKYILCLLLLLHAALRLPAQTKVDRVLFILDGSATMSMEWQTAQSKFQVASEIIIGIIDSVNKNNGEVEFGLRVFGHQFNKALAKCEDTRTEVAYSKDNLAQTSLRLNDLKPKGSGSSSYAIAKALAVDIGDTAHYRYSIVLLQGNIDGCTGDNCTELINSGKRNYLYRLYKIELGEDGTADKYCMDNVFEIKDSEHIQRSIHHIAAQFRVRRPVAPQTPTTKKAPVIIREVKPEKPIPKSIATIAKADTVVAVPDTPKRIIAVEVNKSSKIKVEDPTQFGEINLLNISAIRQMKIYKTNGDKESELMDIFPVGLDQKTVKLPIGRYTLVYTYGYNDASKKIFEVLSEKVLDIPFR